jgi:hypothetical protein
MADGSVPQQQQYPNLNPYGSSNGQTGASYGQQAQDASNSLMTSKVRAHTIHTRALLPCTCPPSMRDNSGAYPSDSWLAGCMAQ